MHKHLYRNNSLGTHSAEFADISLPSLFIPYMPSWRSPQWFCDHPQISNPSSCWKERSRSFLKWHVGNQSASSVFLTAARQGSSLLVSDGNLFLALLEKVLVKDKGNICMGLSLGIDSWDLAFHSAQICRSSAFVTPSLIYMTNGSLLAAQVKICEGMGLYLFYFKEYLCQISRVEQKW